MTFEDFGLGVLASWLANQLGSPKPAESTEPERIMHKAELSIPINDIKSPQIRRFNSYDVFRDLEDILQFVADPIAHIVVENTPSSFYNLAALVVEDRATGIWFVFNRGRMAFQGTGGGAQQTERAVNIFKSHHIPVAPWVLDKSKLDHFESGFILWSDVKGCLIPLISAIESSEDWKWIQKRAKEALYAVERF